MLPPLLSQVWPQVVWLSIGSRFVLGAGGRDHCCGSWWKITRSCINICMPSPVVSSDYELRLLYELKSFKYCDFNEISSKFRLTDTLPWNVFPHPLETNLRQANSCLPKLRLKTGNTYAPAAICVYISLPALPFFSFFLLFSCSSNIFQYFANMSHRRHSFPIVNTHNFWLSNEMKCFKRTRDLNTNKWK